MSGGKPPFFLAVDRVAGNSGNDLTSFLVLPSQVLADFGPSPFTLHKIEDPSDPEYGAEVGSGECSIVRPGRLLIKVDLDVYAHTTYRLSFGVQISPKKVVVNATRLTIGNDGRGQAELKIPRNVAIGASAIVVLTASGEAIASQRLTYNGSSGNTCSTKQTPKSHPLPLSSCQRAYWTCQPLMLTFR